MIQFLIINIIFDCRGRFKRYKKLKDNKKIIVVKFMYLVTGSAGFIGFHLSKLLIEQNKKVVGIDNLNNYYDVKLKKENKILRKFKILNFIN